ncbi:MAG: GNAT family N-acetyltransferase [Muribaculaceae bacterium]|nr:GNAT family N-acetyltransferase [Muribaculaceae bacterium]
MVETIIDEVPVGLLELELNESTFLRKSNKGGNELYVVDAHTAPNTMREIGRLRELAFRAGGGGTGLACDIDEFDTMTPPCRQLVVWDPEARQIIGGYRFILGKDIVTEADGSPRIATAHLFRFSPEFMTDYLPYTIELGRSFVRVEAQATRQSKAIFALDNLWDGLGALTVLHPEIKYLFGKVTMYPEYITECRDMILYFLHKHFPDPDNLVTAIEPLVAQPDLKALAAEFPSGTDFKEGYKHLNKLIREHGLNIPPLVNAYMNLSPTMKVFGTAINREFGDVEETGILITIDEIFDEKKRRHIETFTAGENLKN